MDTGEGRFEKIEVPKGIMGAEGEEEREKAKREALEKLLAKHPNHGGIFTVGEILKIRDSWFRIKAIKPRELRLKLLPRRAGK